jgi:branched-chain amino acid transport system permease protein
MTTSTAPPGLTDGVTDAPSTAGPRRGPRTPAVAGLVAVVVMACLPLLDLRVPGVLPGATYTPGTLHLLTLCMLFAGLALSYHLLYGVAGMLSFGHALYFGAGAYGLAILLQRTDLPLLVAVALVLVGVIVVAHLIGAISLRVSGVSFAMVTLAFAQAGNVLARRNTGGFTGGEEGIALNTANVPAFLVGVVDTRNVYWMVLGVLILVYAVVTWVQHSRAGHVVEATRENEMRVRVIGQQPYLIRLLTFVIAAALAGLVGIAYLLLQSQAVPTITSAELTITLLVMVVLGGVGSRWGAIAGAAVYTLLDQRLSVFADSALVQGLPAVLRIPLSEPLFTLGTLFILVVLFLPGGIAGAARRLGRRGATAGRRRGRPTDDTTAAERSALEEVI